VNIPIITIDGPSGSGKGTIAAAIAQKLGFHLLDSGALYRLVGLAAVKRGISLNDEVALVLVAEQLDVEFKPSTHLNRTLDIILAGEDVTDELRLETSGEYASQVAAKPGVRATLIKRQRAMLKVPGLVADGRDMGTVLFPDAQIKIFLTASAEERAQRRYNQLIHKGGSVNLRALLTEIQARDERDTQRTVAPLKAAEGALVIDSTSMTIAEVEQTILDYAAKRLAC
jgi:cytidylate kinase